MNSSDLGLCNIEDLRQIAKKRLPRPIFEYIDGAAEDGVAIQHNREVYRSLKIKNRVLKDVSKRSTATEIFGKKIAMPSFAMPYRLQRIDHPHCLLRVTCCARAD